MARNRSAFGEAFCAYLDARSVGQAAAARATGKSPQYINSLVHGTKRASPKWVDLIADCLELSPAEREGLHRAAARDHGFKIDLTKP